MQRPSCLQKIYPDKAQPRFQIPLVTNKIFNPRKLHRKRQNLCKMQINLKRAEPYADHLPYNPPNIQPLRITRKKAKPAWKLHWSEKVVHAVRWIARRKRVLRQQLSVNDSSSDSSAHKYSLNRPDRLVRTGHNVFVAGWTASPFLPLLVEHHGQG